MEKNLAGRRRSSWQNKKMKDTLGLLPEACMVVEDADTGIQAAKAGGMYAVGIGVAANCARADATLHTFSDLLIGV